MLLAFCGNSQLCFLTTLKSISKLQDGFDAWANNWLYHSQVDQMDSNPNRKALSVRYLKNYFNAMKKTTHTFLSQLYLLKPTQVVNSCIIYTFLMQISLASFNIYQKISLHSHCKYLSYNDAFRTNSVGVQGYFS